MLDEPNLETRAAAEASPSVGQERALHHHRLMEEGQRGLPMTNSPKVRMRSLSPLLSTTTDGPNRGVPIPRAPWPRERPLPPPPLPPPARAGKRADGDMYPSQEIDRRGRTLEPPNSIRDQQHYEVPAIESDRRGTPEERREEGGKRVSTSESEEDEEEEANVEQSRKWLKEHEEAWSQEHQQLTEPEEESRRLSLSRPVVNQRDYITPGQTTTTVDGAVSVMAGDGVERRNAAGSDPVAASLQSVNTEAEELKQEIELSMRNDQERVREQMESLRRYRSSMSQKPHLTTLTKKRSGLFKLHQKKPEASLYDASIQASLERLIVYLQVMTVENLANSQSRKVIAMSGGLNLPQAYEFMERHGISSAPVYDEEGRTVGTIDSADLMAYILISERPSLLQEVLGSSYNKDPFNKPVAAMIGASGRNQFTMVRASDSVYSLLQVFSLGRPSACVLDQEDMISWVVSQSPVIAIIEEYLKKYDMALGNVLAVDLEIIVAKIPYVREDARAGEAFVSLCIHQAQAAVVVDSKWHFVAEISPRCFRGIEKFNSADFYLPIDKYMSNVHKVSRKGWDAPVTCRPNITLCELLNLVSAKKAHRVWVVEGRKNKVVGLITLTSIIRSLLGVGCLYDQKPPIQGKLGPTYFDVTLPEHWPHVRNTA